MNDQGHIVMSVVNLERWMAAGCKLGLEGEALRQFVTDSQAAERDERLREREHERERRDHDEKVELERREHEEAVESENREQEAREARAVREHEMEMTRLRGDNAAATAGQAIAPAVHAKLTHTLNDSNVLRKHSCGSLRFGRRA